MSAFLSVAGIDQPASAYVARHGRIEREFSHLTQGSGNVSWLIEAPEGRLFIKTAGPTTAPPPGAPAPYFDHPGRVRSLRNAINLARSCGHRALPALLNVIETPTGPMLVYQAVPGELIGGIPPAQRADPASPYQRLAHLPAAAQLPLFDTLIDLHRALADRGWVACDLYDGSMIVDFDTRTLHVVDLDDYRRGPSRNDMGQMFGSTRFMAPEEFELGRGAGPAHHRLHPRPARSPLRHRTDRRPRMLQRAGPARRRGRPGSSARTRRSLPDRRRVCLGLALGASPSSRQRRYRRPDRIERQA